MARYIQTEAQVEECDRITGQWRFTHRGPFSVLKGGNMVGNTKVMKNVANTSVLRWAGRLFCLWEGGDPYEIESTTLDTLGRFDIINGRHKLLQDEDATPKVDVWDVAAEILKPILYGKHLELHNKQLYPTTLINLLISLLFSFLLYFGIKTSIRL